MRTVECSTIRLPSLILSWRSLFLMNNDHSVKKSAVPSHSHAKKSFWKNFWFCIKTLNMVSPLNSHFERFEFVLLQLSLIVLICFACFGSSQCPTTIPECNAMSALQTSMNLSSSITNHGNNATNPCSKKRKHKRKQEQNTYPYKMNISPKLFWFTSYIFLRLLQFVFCFK